MKDENNDPKGILLAVLLTPIITLPLIVVILPFALFNTWAVWLMYGWFVLPLGAPGLSFWHTLGLILLIGLLRGGSGIKDEGSLGEKILKLVVRIVITLVIVLAGFVIKGWI